ncbi:MAG: cytidylate kinase-like family protein [Dehalococcoidia bacterium]|nr:cytidylate kinase-like family protein [Dehalococcoidia bacterium]
MSGKVITVTRQLGSDGEEIARHLAEKMGVPYLEREIISRAAALAGVSEETVQEAERGQSFLERMVELLGRYPVAAELGAPLPDLPPTPALTVDTYRKLIEDVIRSVVEKGPAVILGHGGQVVLQKDPLVLRVYICAPLERRIAYIMTRDGLTAEAARRWIQASDSRITDYFRTYYRVNCHDPLLYDLTINSDRIGVATAVELILWATSAA